MHTVILRAYTCKHLRLCSRLGCGQAPLKSAVFRCLSGGQSELVCIQKANWKHIGHEVTNPNRKPPLVLSLHSYALLHMQCTFTVEQYVIFDDLALSIYGYRLCVVHHDSVW